MTSPQWIDLDGAENARDLAGLRTVDGRTVRPGRLIRTASLQELSDADVRLLVDDLHVRAVADLRTGTEVTYEGPGPMHREARVEVRHLSLFPEPDRPAPAGADGAVVLPWQRRDEDPEREVQPDERRRGAAGVYLRYLDERADSVLAALRLIAHTDGATIVHCAAGKDRTGVVVALALAEVGVRREDIVADYERSAERIEQIVRRMAARPLYAGEVDVDDLDRHRPRGVTLERLLTAVDDLHGGVPAWLRAHGWTEADAQALRAHLLGE